MGPCISENTIAALLDGQLPAEEKTRVMEHIADCVDCRGLYSALAPTLGEEQDTEQHERIFDPPATLVGQRVGALQITRLIGSGSMGEVYEARNADLAQVRAIKVLRPEMAQDRQIQARFHNEARVAGIIRHKGVVEIHDWHILADGSTCIVMEYLEGETLRERLRRAGPLSLVSALRFGRQIAVALAATHRQRIVHRDLKPANVMIVKDADVAGGERTKILDFGIAKVREAERPDDLSISGMKTGTGVIMGTPAYMAPEQFHGAALVDDRADVYALGIMLFEMLVGRLPFSAKTEAALYAQRQLGEAERLAEAAPQLPPRLSQLVAAMLARDPAERPPSQVVAAELSEILAATAAEGSHSTAEVRLPRSRGVMLGAIPLVLALVGGILWAARHGEAPAPPAAVVSTPPAPAVPAKQPTAPTVPVKRPAPAKQPTAPAVPAKQPTAPAKTVPSQVNVVASVKVPSNLVNRPGAKGGNTVKNPRADVVPPSKLSKPLGPSRPPAPDEDELDSHHIHLHPGSSGGKGR